jgi:hypothetical protein
VFGTDSETLDNSVLVVGNGESRKHLDLKKLKSPIIGCNALHRDLIPDILVCCDRRMVEESTNNPLTKDCTIYVRNLWYHYFRKIKKNKNIKCFPDIPYQGEKKSDHPDHWGSGSYALLIAAQSSYKTIYLIGFDLYSSGKTVNNLYKGTRNYDIGSSSPVDPSFWIYQIGKIFQIYKGKKFIIVNDQTWKFPESWIKPNVDYRNIQLLNLDIK